MDDGHGASEVGPAGDAASDAAGDPSVLLTAGSAVQDLQLDTAHLYWSEDHSQILRAPLDGGSERRRPRSRHQRR